MQNNLQHHLIPIAIILAGGIIAATVLFGGEFVSSTQSNTVERANDAHIFGDPDAPVTIVEFSDFECPFCSRLHPTLKRIVTESNGGINWEYRHMPLSIHPNAQISAYAAECVAHLSDNDTFWEYTDTLFSNQRSLGRTFLISEAQKLGIERTTFTQCMSDPVIRAQIDRDQQTALQHGGNGTPFSIIVRPDGTTRGVSGALPYQQWLQLLSQPSP